MIKFKQITELAEDYIQRKVDSYLMEDRAEYDMTTRYAIPKNISALAVVEAEEECVFVGEQVLLYIFEKCDVELKVKDGDVILKNGIIATIKGKASYILSRERVMLNIIQRLSGIATMTRKYVEIAKPYGVQILDTRKTTPGMRLFEKYAVYIGNGTNHRLNLSTAILIKDNHLITGGGIEKVIQNINTKNKYDLQVELEVDTIEQLKEGLALDIKGFLLDNMPPDMIKECVLLIRNSEDGENIFIEASGGISFENLSEYVSTGINAISIGALTHRIVSANIHLNFQLENA
jgi:nicotinate-nucleotide pyrophosphorylase (carboxylating)